MPVVGKEETEYIEYPHSGNSPKKYWIEYWSAFNKYQINDFVYILDEARGKAESKRAWVPGAIFATSIFISIASVALNPLAGLVVGVTSTIVGSAIQYYVDSYPNDLDKVSVAIRQVVYKYPNKTLEISFLKGSHKHQVKICEFLTYKEYAIVDLSSNDTIDMLVKYAEKSGVILLSRGVEWKFQYNY